MKEQRRMPVAWLFAVTMLLFATNFASLAVAEDLDGQQVGIDVSNRLAENLFESVGEQAGTAVAEKLGEGMGDLLGGPIGGAIGGAVASVVMDVITSALFPKKGPSPEDIWNSIKGYAETFMKNAMDQQKLEDMKTELVGLSDEIDDFMYAVKNNINYEMKIKVLVLDSALIGLSKKYVKAGQYEQTLPFLASFATLHLGVLQTKSIIFKDLDAAILQETANNWLKYYNIYVAAINTARNNLLKDRPNYIHADGANDRVTDTYPNPILPNGEWHHQAGTPAAQWGEELRNHFAYSVIVSRAVGEMDVKLNKLLAPMLSWNLLVPPNVTAPGVVVTKRIFLHSPIIGQGGSVNEPGSSYGLDDSSVACQSGSCKIDPDSYINAIGSVTNYMNTIVTIHTFYTNGMRSGVSVIYPTEPNVQCGPGEWISKVEAKGDITVDALRWTTNKGNTGAAGDWGRGDDTVYDSNWMATPRHPAAPLYSVSGYATSNWIEAAAFKWKVFLDLLVLPDDAKNYPQVTDQFLNATAPYY